MDEMSAICFPLEEAVFTKRSVIVLSKIFETIAPGPTVNSKIVSLESAHDLHIQSALLISICD